MFHHTHNALNCTIIVIFAKKLRRSEIIFVSLLTALKFYLYCLAIVKILIFCELYKLQSLFYSKITLNHACEFSLAKL